MAIVARDAMAGIVAVAAEAASAAMAGQISRIATARHIPVDDLFRA